MHAEQRGDEEDVAEQQTEPIDAQGRQREIEQLHLAQLAVRQRQQVCKRQDRQHQHIGAAQPAAKQGDDERAEDEDQTWRYFTDHSSPPAA